MWPAIIQNVTIIYSSHMKSLFIIFLNVLHYL